MTGEGCQQTEIMRQTSKVEDIMVVIASPLFHQPVSAETGDERSLGPHFCRRGNPACALNIKKH
jgi:hypothetical protein